MWILGLKWVKRVGVDYQRENILILNQILLTILKEMYGDQSGQFVCGSWGLNAC